MMDSAYFIGRKELLDFFNDLLDLNLAKIEQTASGAIACQITEIIFPGSIPMNRVNWAARSDYEFVQNYKLLQSAFTKHCVQRHVDVDKLIRAKYQDNLEFCQWLKAFYDQSTGGGRPDDYDPAAVRARGKGGGKYNETMGRAVRSAVRPAAPAARTSAPAPPVVAPSKPKVSSNTAPVTTDRVNRPLRERKANDAAPTTKTVPTSNPDAELVAKNQELLKQIDELEIAVLDTEQERNFYFEKLRNVEIILQVYQEKNSTDPERLVDNVFKILYATAEDHLIVNEDGDVIPSDGNAETAVNEE
jgi:microtubule-associated protein, RP/EB family